MFSVIVPVHEKYKEYLSDCFASILQQSYSDFELLLVCPNHSCDSLLPKHPKAKVVYGGSDNASGGRNAGIDAAKEPYIVFCDCDDMYHKDFLFIASTIIQKESPDLLVAPFDRDARFLSDPAVLSRIHICRSNEETMSLIRQEFFGKPPFSNVSLPTVWGKVFRRDYIIKFGLRFIDPPPRAEDALFSNDYFLHTNKMTIVLGTSMYFNRPNSRSMTTSMSSEWLDLERFLACIRQQFSGFIGQEEMNLFSAKQFRELVHGLLTRYRARLIDRKELRQKLEIVYGDYREEGDLRKALSNERGIYMRIARHRQLFVLLSPFLARLIKG